MRINGRYKAMAASFLGEDYIRAMDIQTREIVMFDGDITVRMPDQSEFLWVGGLLRMKEGVEFTVLSIDPTVLLMDSANSFYTVFDNKRHAFNVEVSEAFKKMGKELTQSEIDMLYSLHDSERATTRWDMLNIISNAVEKLSNGGYVERDICCAVLPLLFGTDATDVCIALRRAKGVQFKLHVENPARLTVNDQDISDVVNRIRRLCSKVVIDPAKHNHLAAMCGSDNIDEVLKLLPDCWDTMEDEELTPLVEQAMSFLRTQSIIGG